MLTLLCVIYQPHKENAVYSELISKLFSLRVSEQAGSCPELQSHLQRPVLAAGPAPRGTAPAASLQGSVVHRGHWPHSGVGVKKVSGGGGVSFLTPSFFACLPQISVEGLPSLPRPPDPDIEGTNIESGPLA